MVVKASSNFVVSLIHVFINCFSFVHFYAYFDCCVTGHQKEGDCKEHGCNAYSIVALVILMIIHSIVLITCALRCVRQVYLGPMDTRKQVVKSLEKKHECIGHDPWVSPQRAYVQPLGIRWATLTRYRVIIYGILEILLQHFKKCISKHNQGQRACDPNPFIYEASREPPNGYPIIYLTYRVRTSNTTTNIEHRVLPAHSGPNWYKLQRSPLSVSHNLPHVQSTSNTITNIEHRVSPAHSGPNWYKLHRSCATIQLCLAHNGPS